MEAVVASNGNAATSREVDSATAMNWDAGVISKADVAASSGCIE